MIKQLAKLLKVLGEPTRLKIVKLLSFQEFCVCELVAIMDISQPRVSQHLKALKEAGIVNERRDKQKSFYSLNKGIKAGEIPCFEVYMTTDIRRLPDFYLEAERLTSIKANGCSCLGDP